MGPVKALPAWSEKFETGATRVDEKRRKILWAFSRCFELHVEGIAPGKLLPLISDALDVADACLKFEEMALRAARWDGTDEHVAYHDRWREESRRIAGGRGAAIVDPAARVEEFFAYAGSWLQRHLGVDDLKYAEKVRNSGF